jgi:ferredoxin, 2Fe-2S
MHFPRENDDFPSKKCLVRGKKADYLDFVNNKKTYKITFKPQNKTVEVPHSPSGFHGVGEKGSILDVAIGLAKIDIEHSCGGVAACSTCHVIVEDGLESCNEASDQELDQLDNAPDNTLKSRLSCQCIPSGEKDIVVRIPDWNRNLVKENPH